MKKWSKDHLALRGLFCKENPNGGAIGLQASRGGDGMVQVRSYSRGGATIAAHIPWLT